MAAKIFRINYKSDFILTMNSDAGWAIPFCIKFWTSVPSRAYFVGFDGTTYTHCAYDPSEPTKLVVQFDDHHLPIGDLNYQIAYHFTVADFPNDTEDEVINPATITTEIDGETYHVMLDFTGETAPEIEFSLPAYANEQQRIQNELQRQQNEAARIAAELQREQATAAAVQGAENVNAQLNGTTLTVTNRQGVSTSVNTKGEQGEQGPAGPAGPQGEQGVSIVSFRQVYASETATYYSITFSDGHEQSVAIPKGAKGDTGATGPTGPQGPQGDTGVSITGFVETGETETATLYNITFSNGTTQAVAIPKGEKGDQGPVGPQGPQGPMGDVAVITPEQQAAFTMYSVPGQHTNGPMTQKAVTDSLVGSAISYDNSQSGFASNNVQGALDEISDTLANSDDVTIGDMSLFASGMNISTTTYSSAPNINLYRLDLTGLALQTNGTKGKLKVTSSPNSSWFVVMNTCNTPINDASIGTFATGYSGRIVMPASTTDTFIIPADCNYIIFAYNPNLAIFPTAISIINTFSYQELKDLEDDVDGINREIYIGGYHVPTSVNSPGAALTGLLSEGVLTLTQNTQNTGLVSTDINTNGVDYTIKFSAKMVNGTSQTIYVGYASSILADSTKLIRVSGTEYTYYELSLKGNFSDNPYQIAFTIIKGYAVVGNIISIKDIVVTFDGETKSILERLNDLEQQGTSGGFSYTFNTDAFLQGCDRYSKYLTKICCAGDSLIANAIGGSIPSSVDEGADNRRPMRLLTNGVARRLYDYISWNKPIWRRLDHGDWTKSGWTAFTSSQMNIICQGTNPSLWKATSQGSYAEITIPQGYEHFALIVRLKSGNGTLNVTLNGSDVGTYTNPYYTSKVATNSVVNASVVPQYVARGLSSINTNSGTTATGNIYHIVEYNNLPSGQANTLRFTTASATEVDIWGGFYWSGNTCVVMNIAQGGHTTSDLLNDHLPDELFAEDYDAVLFEVTEMNNLRLSIAQTKIDMQTIITALRNMGVDHCFTSCNPLGLSIEHDTNFYTTYSNPSQLDVNNAVSELMKEQAEAFIDIFQYFRWHIERRGGTLVGGQGGLWYTWDGQHGNAAGVKLWFDALIKVIAHKSIMID